MTHIDQGEGSMAKVLGMHTLELKPGCDSREFEEMMIRDVLPVYNKIPGQTTHLLKGDRGERSGKYVLLIELESVEARDHVYPSEGILADDVQQLIGNIDPVWEQFYSFVEGFPDPKYTDYVMVSD
jgi:hypothetical protein